MTTKITTSNSLTQKLFSLLHHVFLLLPPQILYFIFRLPKQRILIQSLFFVFLVFVFTLIAVVSYMMVYFWYIPPISHQKQVYFQYYK